jgi:hypothetical protein
MSGVVAVRLDEKEELSLADNSSFSSNPTATTPHIPHLFYSLTHYPFTMSITYTGKTVYRLIGRDRLHQTHNHSYTPLTYSYGRSASR